MWAIPSKGKSERRDHRIFIITKLALTNENENGEPRVMVGTVISGFSNVSLHKVNSRG